jgi:hypothetical protein
MITPRNGIILTVFLLVVMIAGCSGSGDPVNPGTDREDSSNLPIIALTEAGDASSAIGMLGSFELNISPDEQTAELVPDRSSAIGQSYIVNGKSFFTITPCPRCLVIKSISLTADGLIQLTFAISHPFDPGDPLKPPSAINRLDLDVFDMALIVRPLEVTPDSYTLLGASAYVDYIENASGYTRELENVIDDDAAMPFLLVIDDNAAGKDTFNKFAMGAEDEFDLIVNVSGTTDFKLYLTMGYGASATKQQRLNPTYYNPEFNKKAAWKVITTPPNGNDPPDYGNTWNEVDDTTLHEITVQVFDWQVGANIDPDLTNPTDVFASSEVSAVRLEIPGMHNTLLEQTTPLSGTGAPDDPLIYSFQAANENLLTAGEYTALVKVIDARIPGDVVIGGETDTIADSINGIDLEWAEIAEYATYQTVKIVILGIEPYVLEIPNGGESWPAESDQSITWSGGTGFTTAKLEYSKDDFAADIHEIIASTENDGEFTWTVPDDPSDTVKVRISAPDYPWVNTISADYFSITSGLDEMIVYCADGPASGRQIYTIDPEGVGPAHQWTTSSAIFNECAKLSPCGRYIIYTAADFSAAELRIIDVTTGIETNINPAGLNTVYGDFSHDGTKIVGACAAIWWDAKELYSFDYTGNNAVQLTTGADAWSPTYSEDDSQIYYQNFGDSQVYIYDVTAGTTTQYTNNGTWNDDPVGNPEGTHVAWATMYGNG